MATRKTTAPKAKQTVPTKAEAPEPKAEPVPETSTPETVSETRTLNDAVAPNAEQEAPASEETAENEATQPTEIKGETITGDGTGKALPTMEEMPGVFVRTTRRIKSRRRAVFRFNREGVGIALELLTEEQLTKLRDDPALEVEDCTFPLEEATSEPEA